MVLKNQNILFFSRSTQHGGTENVILQLCEIFQPLVNKIVVVSSEGFAVDKLRTYGIKHISIPDIENKTPKTIFYVSKKIKEIINNEHITIIHTHHRMAAFYVRLLGLYKHCKFINTSHNTFTNHRMLTRFAYKKANLIACGEMVKRNLTSVFGFKNVTVIHNGVKPFNGSIVVNEYLKKDKEQGKYLIGNIGRLSKQKGMEYYIKAIPAVIDKHPEAQFYIIGSGEEEKLKTLSKGLPVQFLGYRTDIQNIMAQLDLIVLSSLWEGLPLTPIEAFSVGKTIVATEVDGTIEIVTNGINGELVRPQCCSEIAEKICKIMDSPELQNYYEKNGKSTYEKKFSFDSFSNAYKGYYMSL